MIRTSSLRLEVLLLFLPPIISCVQRAGPTFSDPQNQAFLCTRDISPETSATNSLNLTSSSSDNFKDINVFFHATQ